MTTPRKSEVEKYFNEEAQSWMERYSKIDFESVSYQDRMNAALHLLRKYGLQKMLVLDAGCGAGLQAAAIQNAGHDVIACDISHKMAKRARDVISRKTKSRVFVADLEHGPIRESAFDAIVMLGVLGYADRPERVLTSVNKMLKPNGVLIISSASQRLLLSQVSEFASFVPNKIYLGLKRFLSKNRSSSEKENESFYVKNYNYMRPSEFDAFLQGCSFVKSSSIGVNYGRFRFMGKTVFTEKCDISISRFIGRLARMKPLRFIQEYSRIYVVCARKQ